MENILKKLPDIEINGKNYRRIIELHNRLITIGEFVYERVGKMPFNRKEVALIRCLSHKIRKFIGTKLPEEKRGIMEDVKHRKSSYWRES